MPDTDTVNKTVDIDTSGPAMDVDVAEEKDLTEIESVTEACDAGGGCHSCHILIQFFIDEHEGKSTAMEDLVHNHAQKVKKKGILSRFFKKY